MISIIICSRNPVMDSLLDENIRQTIGAEYEIVLVDNSEGKYGICGAYNEGVRRSKGDILCFMHEDIHYYTENWGKKVEDHFREKEMSLLSTVGSHILPSKGDWRVGYHQYAVLSFLQRTPRIASAGSYYVTLAKDGIPHQKEGSLIKVASVDGVWFCIPRNVFEDGKICFDETSFPGFHMYDIDISMQVNKIGGSIYVCDDILFEHFSEGNFSADFYTSLMKFQQKWQKYLPVIVGCDLTTEKLNEQGQRAEEMLLERIKRDGMIPLIRKRGAVSQAERKMVADAEYAYAKKVVKYKKPLSGVVSYLTQYIKDDVTIRKKKILWKFIAYRILHFPVRKMFIEFHDQ